MSLLILGVSPLTELAREREMHFLYIAKLYLLRSRT